MRSIIMLFLFTLLQIAVVAESQLSSVTQITVRMSHLDLVGPFRVNQEVTLQFFHYGQVSYTRTTTINREDERIYESTKGEYFSFEESMFAEIEKTFEERYQFSGLKMPEIGVAVDCDSFSVELLSGHVDNIECLVARREISKKELTFLINTVGVCLGEDRVFECIDNVWDFETDIESLLESIESNR